MEKATEKLWNSVLEKNAHFQKALSFMNEEAIKKLEGDFQKIIELKKAYENEKEFLQIAIDENDIESELYYEKRFFNIRDEIEYKQREISDYINSVLRNNEK